MKIILMMIYYYGNYLKKWNKMMKMKNMAPMCLTYLKSLINGTSLKIIMKMQITFIVILIKMRALVCNRVILKMKYKK